MNDKYFSYQRKDVVNLLPDTYSKVLEIGCAEGNFRDNLDKNCEYWGIEPDVLSAEVSSTKLYKVLVGKYKEVYSDLPDNYFDLIICNDVIEHMEDHDYFFDSIKTKLAKNAYIVASIPNVRYLENIINIIFKKDWKYTSNGILDKTHLRFFYGKKFKKYSF